MKEYDIMPEKIKCLIHIIGGENGLDFAEEVWDIVTPTANGYGWNDGECFERLKSVIILTRAFMPKEEVLKALRSNQEFAYRLVAVGAAEDLLEKLNE